MKCKGNVSEAKEISIVSKCKKGDGCEDLLRISKNWISYRKTNKKTGEEIASWSYKSTSEHMIQYFSDICGICVHEFNDPYDDHMTESEYEFNVRATYDNNMHDDIHRIGTMGENRMGYLAICILKMIPHDEHIPEILTVYKTIELNREILPKIDVSDIEGFMFAEGGAMGDPGCVHLLTSSLIGYYLDGDNYKESSLYQDDALSILGDLNEIEPVLGSNISRIKINGKCWFYIYLGFRNHLVISDKLYREIGNYLIDTDFTKTMGKLMAILEPNF